MLFKYVCIKYVYDFALQDNCPTVHNPNQNLEACNVTQGNGLTLYVRR